MAQQPEKLSPAEQAKLDEAGRKYKKERDEQAQRNREASAPTTRTTMGEGKLTFKKGGSVKSSASRRADGIAQRGKTKGRLI